MKYLKDYVNKIHCSDALKFLKKLPDESVDMCISSPPYWGLRDYHVKGQIGLDIKYSAYIEKLVKVFQEVKRVLKSTGTFYLVMGDTYMDKELLMIPAQLALELKKSGWKLRNILIWHKPNSMPTSVKDRYKNSYEFVFFFVKSRRYYFDIDSIREPHKTVTRSKKVSIDGGNKALKRMVTIMAQHAPHRGKRDYKDPELFQKQQRIWFSGKHENNLKGKNPGDVIMQNRDEGRLKMTSKGPVPATQDYHKSFNKREDDINNKGSKLYKQGRDKKYPAGPPNRHGQGWGEGYGKHTFLTGNHPLGKNPGDFLIINTKPFKGAHFAVFPETLCEKPIKSSCPKDGIVIDPFCGSGTACVVAKRLDRKFIGIDLNPEYCEIARKRLNAEKEHQPEFKFKE